MVVNHLPKLLIRLTIAAIALALAHPFRAGDIAWNASWLTMLISIGGASLAWRPLASGSRSQRFWRGIFFGFVSFSAIWYWISYALKNFGDLPLSLSILITLILSFYCSLYWGLWALIAGSPTIVKRPLAQRLILWASLWAALESARQWILTGFSWGEWGYAATFSPFLSASASLVGVHGLTFFFMFLSGLVAAIYEKDSGSPLRVEFLKQIAKIFLTVLVVMGILTALSRWHIAQISTPGDAEVSTSSSDDNTTLFKIGLVQPNIAQDIKWDPASADKNLEKLLGLSYALVPQNPDFIAWPETAYPFLISSSQEKFDLHLSTPLLFGAVFNDEVSNKNAVIQLQADGQKVNHFSKRHLVPFGEYVPLKEYIPFGKVVENVGDFMPGSFAQNVLQIGERSLKVGPLICYEDIFSRSSVSLARKGSELLVNFTNDAWYGKTSAIAQHAAISHMQSYQSGLPLLRVTNNGQSSLMSPLTRIDIPAFQEEAMVMQVRVKRNPSPTFFVATYPLMEWIWFLLFAIACLWKRPQKRNRQSSTN